MSQENTSHNAELGEGIHINLHIARLSESQYVTPIFQPIIITKRFTVYRLAVSCKLRVQTPQSSCDCMIKALVVL